MVASVDRVLQNGRLADGRLVDLHVGDGRFVAIVDAGSPVPDGVPTDDLGQWLVLAAMAEPHAHLDKALTSEQVPNPTGDLMGAIDAWIAAAATGMFTHDDMVARATSAMERLLVHGVTAVRTHVNVTAANRDAAVLALREARAGFAGLLDVQIVALTSFPLTGPDASPQRSALEAALEAGVDLVGGCSHLDPDGPAMITYALERATEAGLGIDLHVDETLDADMLTLDDLARQVIDTGFEFPVAASHCVSLGMQTPARQAEIAARVAEAGISVFPLPQTNLFLQGRDDAMATPRGLTAVNALQEAGVVVAAGADNVQDPFNLVGRSDPLETASLMVMAGHQLPDVAYDLVSNQARIALGLEPVRFEVGDPADLVAIDAPSARGAMADAPMSRRVYRHGVLVASADEQTSVHR